MHNGLLTIDNEKMSKSVGNFFTIREVLERFDGETIRFFMVRTHYRSPVQLQRREPRGRAPRAAPPLHRARRGRSRWAGGSRLERAARRPRSARR
jgi:cysteinyl-tRNA synthetase